MPLRVVHLVSSLDRYAATRDVPATIAALPADDFTSSVCVLDPRKSTSDEFRRAGLDSTAIQARWRFDPFALVRLVAELRRVRPDVVHAWDFPAGVYAAAAVPLTGSSRLVIGPHGFARRLSSRPFSVPRHAELLLTTSECLRVELQKRLPGARCEVLPPGVADSPPADFSRAEFCQELHLPEDAKLIGVAGPLVPRMGVKELIWAADMVRVLHGNIRLVMAGDGPQRPHLERFARTAADPRNICFVGDYPHPERLMAHLDVFWQGSERGAESPFLLDAMAAGVPVVASDTPHHRELIRDGESGFLAGLADRAAWTRLTDRLLTDASLARGIGQAGQRHVLTRFAWQKKMIRLHALYRELLRGERRT